VEALIQRLTATRAELASGRDKYAIRVLDHLIERANDDGVLAGIDQISPVLVGKAAGIGTYAMREGGPGGEALAPWVPFFRPSVRTVDIAATPQDETASYVARVRALIRDKAKNGGTFAADDIACRRASMRAIADEAGIPFSKLRGNPHIRQEVRNAISSGLVPIGALYRPAGPAITPERLAELKAVVTSFDVEGGKVPENPNRRGAPDFDRIAQLTGKPGPNGKESYTYCKFVQAIARRRGTELPGVTASNDTFANLLVYGLESIEIAQKSRGLTTWANGVANHKSALERFCEKLGLTIEDEIGETFGVDFSDNVVVAAAGLSAGSEGNFKRYMNAWRELRVQRFEVPELAQHFGPALKALREARGYTVQALSRSTDIPVATLRGWERETIGVAPGHIAAVGRVEATLKAPTGTLLAKATKVRGRMEQVEGATEAYRALSSRVRGLLPYSAAFWKADRLNDAVAKVSPLLRAGTEFGDLIQLTRAEENRLSAFVPTDLISSQLEAFCTYKTVPMPYPLLRTTRWISDNTRDKGMERLRKSLRFATTPQGDTAWSGLGLPTQLQTMAWSAVPPIALAYAGQRAKRFEEMEWKGEARGTFYTEDEVGYLEQLVSLTHPTMGWLVQNPELADTLVPLSQTLPRQFDDLLQLYTANGPAPLLSEDDVAAARRDWPGHIERCHRHYLQARSRVMEIAQVSRNPYESVSGLMLAGEPMAEYLALLYTAEKRWSCPRTARHLWRTDVRDSAIARLAPITGFRPFNLIEAFTFTGDERGQIRKLDGVWDIEVPYKLFKNWKNCRLFGTRTSPRNFRMQLRDECGLYEVLDTWFFEALPELRAAGDARPAFVNRYGDPMTTGNYGDMMQVFGARHIAWNPVLETGFPGVTSMNPYQVRHLRASDTLKNSTAANRVEEAAFAIQTSERMIVNHYGFLVPEQAILTGYDTFSEQARKAWARVRI
jgi:transcriptional regulator with XRE-family HTH domain